MSVVPDRSGIGPYLGGPRVMARWSPIELAAVDLPRMDRD